MKSKIVIGDVHGCYETLMRLMEKLPHDDVVFCGDLIDRGPKSREVVQFVIDNNYDCVMGNHEDLMVSHNGVAMTSPSGMHGISEVNGWGTNGGFKTLQSYTDREGDIKDHIEWMKNLPYVRVYKDVVNDKDEKLMVSHSIAYHGFKRIDVIDEEYFGQVVMWNRDFHNIKPMEGFYNVFGHTPQNAGARVKSFYACVDTGCVYKSGTPGVNNGFGLLSALQYPEMKLFEQEMID